VTYRDYKNNTLKYARKSAGGKWGYQVLEAMGRPLYSRLFVGPRGKLHIAIENLERIYYGACLNCVDM